MSQGYVNVTEDTRDKYVTWSIWWRNLIIGLFNKTLHEIFNSNVNKLQVFIWSYNAFCIGHVYFSVQIVLTTGKSKCAQIN